MKTLAIKVKSRLLNRLRNDEHAALLGSIDILIEANSEALPEIQPLYGNFHRLYREEGGIYKRDATAVETKFIVAVHRTRRAAFILVRRSVEAASYDDDPALRDAAAMLKEVLRNHRSVTTVSMYEVTPLVHNMIEDLRKPRYVAAVTTLGLDAAVGKLEARNEEFRDIYLERAHNREVFDIQGSMEGIRPKVNSAFLDLAGGINAYYLSKRLSGKADAENPYRDIIVSIDGFVEQARLNLERRRRGAHRAKDDPGDVGALIP
ncbi:MAG: DUF6261 family protein [Tannerellaceae bacterium]|jgi:hypothetical protein|nr:DUF6261 family protein [Tannerellaceae bacterium]